MATRSNAAARTTPPQPGGKAVLTPRPPDLFATASSNAPSPLLSPAQTAFAAARPYEIASKAARKKVEVEIILDATDDETTLATAKSLSLSGIPVRIDSAHGTFHNKIILIDDHTIVTGSYNFTMSAEHSNAENLVILKGFPEVFDQYWRNYLEHRQHAQVYAASADKGPAATPPGPAEEDTIVFVTRAGKKYHTADCQALTENPIPLRLSEAKSLGYLPCLKCSPPE